MQMCGGFTAPKSVSDEGKKVLADMHGAIIEKLHADGHFKEVTKFNVFEALEESTQVVAGTIRKLKVKVDGEKHLLVSIFHPLPHTNEGPKLHALEVSQ
uniref:Cystatin domain-containing protein n=1 Tax=Chromera velia CCMP2878 TaxID=1169474 RepID=A0A0G4HE24_9ALVE|mmetsp:Transcript_3071/g.6263  ORF Transcript_3071/g.6263 Transcript_3071/m.6263 type:complete len:99 (-) Transcript_3071:909-1205(-)|eukprot:Cvel_6441.t1-p1 / transcript=Cvel_6441.t1 / gene=Cvel_6441 / organism=Chromera_velia_CCMP2878 / gene_product=Cystatin-B, putative / transcript_product=Cystatin-B, putative / location=Cvel_scaffold315:46865-48472(-) / protein_length=98 / sequence_SO=supercontig / SO=protein_coding / is_pseudo=false